MRIARAIFLLLGLVSYVRCKPLEETKEDEGGLLDCLLEDTSVAACLGTRLARDIDRIELQVTGKRSETPMSAVVQQTGRFLAEVLDDLRNPRTEESEDDEKPDQAEARKKKFGKRKKKHLQKLLGIAMLFKAKLSLLLQLISTHFQLKFFVIAIVSLILNAARFWLDLKKSHPAKVIYYEHAQHQHHYDHDEHDHSGYWGRSSKESPQDLAYAAHVPEK